MCTWLAGGFLAAATALLPAAPPAAAPAGAAAPGVAPAANTALPPVEDKIWTGIILADTAGKDGPVRVGNRWPGAMGGREKQLQRIFGYRHFKILGQTQRKIRTGEEDWLVPSKNFYLKVDTKQKIPGGYLMNLQLWQDKKMLVEATVKIRKTGPLYIRGPLVGRGQLIVAVVCGGKDSAWVRAYKPKLAVQPLSTAPAGPSPAAVAPPVPDAKP
ncbi:MAG: hypothetical protein JSR82_17315 [Verrucomicrobia bacterium]|nr:hypothetical protein [Verrucomicrobiota bacterium]